MPILVIWAGRIKHYIWNSRYFQILGDTLFQLPSCFSTNNKISKVLSLKECEEYLVIGQAVLVLHQMGIIPVFCLKINVNNFHELAEVQRLECYWTICK